MNVKLKICGMRDPENIQEVAALHPEYMGFIFYNNSPRYVADDFIMPVLPTSIKKVAVFVNEYPNTVQTIVGKYQFDFIQLHGNESVEECERLKHSGIKIIKVFSIHDQFDFKITADYRLVTDYFLFDTKGKYHGGNAQTFDWKILSQYDQQIPFFLSGGLSINNIQDVKDILGMNIHALDLNSGVEISPGLKSLSKIKDIQSVLLSNS